MDHGEQNLDVFDLPERLRAKADPALISRDEQQFVEIARCLAQQISELSARLRVALREPGGEGQEAMDRDAEVHRLSSRLRILRRFGLDVCLGRIVTAASPDPVYVGRLSLRNDAGRLLLIDWRAPAAEPFFGATHASPMGLTSRRRYRWSGGRIIDYWDEVFDAGEMGGNAALDDQSAFIASLGSSRSPQMRDVLATIQADQDAIIRASARGPLVVDGGPGTGKTVVALHRAAYLLYSEPRLARGDAGVLFVGPHQPYLSYVADVLPSLGEDSVHTCTLRDLVAEGANAVEEGDAEVARLKSSVAMVQAIEPAVAFYEEPPGERLLIKTPWDDTWLEPAEWADAFAAAEPGMSHNDARREVWLELVDIVIGKLSAEIPERQLRHVLAQNAELTGTFNRAWPVLDPAQVVSDLWSVPAYLRLAAPWLESPQVAALQRDDPWAWTRADLPLLDAARARIGDPEAYRRRLRRERVLAAEREQMDRVVEDLAASDDSEMGVMAMLRGHDLQNTLVDGAAAPISAPDALAGTFAHVIVDEAQELTDAEWLMLLRRCPSLSFTIVGDRAQARLGFTESWRERLERVGFRDISRASLTVNYRTPEEVMDVAAPVIRAVLPDANVPTSVRRSGLPVRYGSHAQLEEILAEWLDTHAEGLVCVIGDVEFASTPRVSSLTPELAKGLEFDLVVLVDPGSFGGGTEAAGTEAAVDRYVSMTRATQQLVILTASQA